MSLITEGLELEEVNCISCRNLIVPESLQITCRNNEGIIHFTRSNDTGWNFIEYSKGTKKEKLPTSFNKAVECPVFDDNRPTEEDRENWQ